MKELVVEAGKIYEREELALDLVQKKIDALSEEIALLEAKKAELEAKKAEALDS